MDDGEQKLTGVVVSIVPEMDEFKEELELLSLENPDVAMKSECQFGDSQEHITQLLQAFDVFSGKQHKVGQSQVYLILAELLPLKGQDVDPATVQEAFDEKGYHMVDKRQFIEIVSDVLQRTAEEPMYQEWSGFGSGFMFSLVLYILPISIFVLRRKRRKGGSIMVDLLRLAGVSHAFRSFITKSKLAFAAFWVFISLIYFILYVGLALSFWRLTEEFDHTVDSIGLTSGELIVGPIIFLVLVPTFVNVFLTTDDKDQFMVRKILLEQGSLDNEHVTLSSDGYRALSEFCGKPVNSQNQLATTEVLLASLFATTEEQSHQVLKTNKITHVLITGLSLLYGCIPFITRGILGRPILGQCLPEDQGKMKHCNKSRMLIYGTISGFMTTIIMMKFALGLIVVTSKPYYERRKTVSRLLATLDQESATEKKVPYMPLTSPNNVLAWSKLRNLVLHYRGTEIKRVEVVLSVIILGYFALVPFLLWHKLADVGSQTMSVDLYVFYGYMGITTVCVGVYLVNPILLTALGINEDQTQWEMQLKYEKWARARALGTTNSEGEELKHEERTYNLLVQLDTYLQEVDSTFKVLGIGVTRAFLTTIITAGATSVASFLSQFLP